MDTGHAVTTTGLDCTKRRQHVTVRRTGWTAIRRRTVGGTAVSLIVTNGVFDIHAKASKIEAVPKNTDTHVKWLQVFTSCSNFVYLLLYLFSVVFSTMIRIILCQRHQIK